MGRLTGQRGITYNTSMTSPRVVIDTNVLVAALRSKRGVAYRLLLLMDSEAFEICVSVPLVLEYESAAKRQAKHSRLTARDVDAIIDYICSVATAKKIFYLWRPVLKDCKDDMVLELAVAAGCEYVITFNTSDFAGAERFGIKIVTPREFLQVIGELP